MICIRHNHVAAVFPSLIQQSMGTAPDRATLIQTVNSRQWDLEKSWGACNTSPSGCKKKLLKAYGQRHTPSDASQLRYKKYDVVDDRITPRIEGLSNAHLVDKPPCRNHPDPPAKSNPINTVWG